ncbi:MAG: helix-turn-helix domain-containing protein [Oscillospiraceae bacterium]|nr:helix-turn-helix domain-containing protein [Oscillospiraceae bacterium]
MTREEHLKALIIEQYGTVSKFAQAAGIPQNTIRNIFVRGLDGVGAGTVVKICSALNVDVESLMAGSPAAPKHDITFDDFTYAMHNEMKDLPPEKKEMLLNMARFFNEELQKEKAD